MNPYNIEICLGKIKKKKIHNSNYIKMLFRGFYYDWVRTEFGIDNWKCEVSGCESEAVTMAGGYVDTVEHTCGQLGV